ncbi:oligopeptide ABC transporter substrate-binding protein [Variovorax sp. VRV01]|nr:oligopeptide ABC transporter substrate-binding protein [Variovorax sp. VRV01]
MSGFPSIIEPVMSVSTATRRLAPQLFDTLIAFEQNESMALRPALAERWERVDGKAVRLFLRKGVVFHDGSSFTAEDVAFSLSPDHLLGPGKAGRSAAMATLDTIEGVRIVDAHTVVIHTKGDDVLLEKRLASWCAEIVSKRAFAAAGAWDKWMAAPVGTGPYKLVRQTLDVNVVLSAHDAYWGGRPPFAGIEFKTIPEASSRVNALAAGEVDVITDLAPDAFADVTRRAGLEVAGGAVQNIRYLAIDQNDPVLSKVGVRRALSLALDRKTMIEALWQNRLYLPNGFQLPSYGEGYIKDYPMLAHDPALARKLLKEAGYNGEVITYKLLNDYYPNQVIGAQTMVEMWKAVGLNVKIQMMENFSQLQVKGSRAIFDSSSTAIFPDHLAHAWREFSPKGTLPQVGLWKNDEYFGLGAKLKGTADVQARRPIIRRMLDILTQDDPPCVVLHGSGQFYGKRREVAWAPGQTLDLNFGPFNRAYAGR